MTTTSRRRPFDQHAEAQPQRPGDAFSQTTARQLAHDTGTDRTGEIMHIARENELPVQIWLRDVGGGCEWIAEPANVHLVQRHPATCACDGTGEVAAAFGLPDIGALLTTKPCPGGQP